MRRRNISILIALTVSLFLFALLALKRELRARNCLANIKSMGCAAYTWSQNHGGGAPTNLLCFSTELVTPKMMLCPADSTRTASKEWASFGSENTSYELVGAEGAWGSSNRVFLRCKVHGYVCFADGSVSRRAPPRP
jgi:hypothetical protein